MQGYQAMNGKLQLPQRAAIQTAPQANTNNLIAYVSKQTNRKKEGTEQSTKNNTNEASEPLVKLAREDAIIYADDTNSITEFPTPKQLVLKLHNYNQITISRQVGINWGKVHIMTRTKNTGK